MLLLSSSSRLLRLNIRGIAPMVLATLLCVELPHLRILQCGDSDAHGLSSRAHIAWPHELLPGLARAFPTLEGLDVAYALTPRGVSYGDVIALCRMCRIRDLDLSQVILTTELYTRGPNSECS